MGGYFSSNQLPDYNPDDYIDEVALQLSPASYPNYGNYTSESVPLNELAARPIEEQAKFSDAICRRYAKNPIFGEMQKGAWQLPTYDELNETSIGNAAFMKIHNPNDQFWVEKYNDIMAVCLAGPPTAN